MLLDDAAADGQADAGTGVFVSGVQATEDFEDLLVLVRGDADSIIPHCDRPLAVGVFR